LPASNRNKVQARAFAYVNGRVLPAEKAVVSVFDRGLVLGDGLFETVRAVAGRPQFFSLHFKRLAKSAKRLRIRLPLDAAELGESMSTNAGQVSIASTICTLQAFPALISARSSQTRRPACDNLPTIVSTGWASRLE